jgi:hypothetical protein
MESIYLVLKYLYNNEKLFKNPPAWEINLVSRYNNFWRMFKVLQRRETLHNLLCRSLYMHAHEWFELVRKSCIALIVCF